jgi:serine/threonine-protein kinase
VLTVKSGPENVTVRDVSNMTEGAASNQLEADGFKTSSTSEASDSVQKGRVIRTEPAAGTSRPKGSTITIVVSSGPQDTSVTVPSVVGKTEEAATADLTDAGFDVNVVDVPTEDQTQDGRVAAQNPTGGKKAPSGSTVTITVTRVGGD